MAEKLEVRSRGSHEWAVGQVGHWHIIRDEADAHLFAAAGLMREAIAEFLRWENVREHNEAEWQEETEKLAIALAAARVPEPLKADDVIGIYKPTVNELPEETQRGMRGPPEGA